MFKKSIALFLVTVVTYLGYCFTRGIIHGFTHPNMTDDEIKTTAKKIATFRA